MIPLQHLVKQMETFLQCYGYETIAMCREPERQDPYVHRLAKDLVQYLALFLAETVAAAKCLDSSVKGARRCQQCAPF